MREPLLIVTDGNPGGSKRSQRSSLEASSNVARSTASRTSWARLRRKCATNSRRPSLSRSMRTARARAEEGSGGDRSVPSTIPERDEVHGRDPRSVSSGATPSCGASQKASHVESKRTFGEHKRRTKVIPHFFTEEAANRTRRSPAALLRCLKNKNHRTIESRCSPSRSLLRTIWKNGGAHRTRSRRTVPGSRAPGHTDSR